jgi:hypothetical protein
MILLYKTTGCIMYKENSFPDYIGSTGDKFSLLEVRIVGTFLKTDPTFTYPDSLIYFFETNCGRKVKWLASGTPILNCFEDLDIFDHHKLADFIRENRENKKQVWLKIKCSIKNHESFKNKNGEVVRMSSIIRVSSIGNVYNNQDNKISNLNEKYVLSELNFLSENTIKSINHKTIYLYKFLTPENKTLKIYSFEKVNNIPEYFRMPYQVSFNNEMIGYSFKNKKVVKSFTEKFKTHTISQKKASKYR